MLLKIIGVQNELPITSCLDLVCSKILRLFHYLIILLPIKSEQKVIQK